MENRYKVKTFGQLDLPRKLYKYRNWNNDNHKTILTNNEIFFCPPFELQSKDEFNLPTDYFSAKDDDLLCYYYKESYYLKVYLTHSQRKEYAKDKLREAPFQDENFRKKIENEFRENLNKNFGIFSASKRKDIQELWNSFAHQSTGFCVGFYTDNMFHKDETYIDGYEINYFKLDNPPKFKLFYDSDQERGEDVIKVLYNLPDKYKSEEEYRLLRYIHSENKPIQVPIESYAEIILGENISNNNRKEILTVINDRYPNIKKFQACNKNGKYTFEIL